MPRYPMFCPKCAVKTEVISSVAEYEATVRGKTPCDSCGTLLEPDFSSEARGGVGGYVDFKPHYNYAIGEHVSTKKEMFEKAARKGVKLNRAY